MIYLDFETRSRINLNQVDAWAYAQHPSTQVMCAAWAVDDGPVGLWHMGHPGFIKESPPPQELIDAILLNELIEAHNASFERAIILNTWHRHCPWAVEIAEQLANPDRWRCSAAAAASFGLPRGLDGAAEALRLDVRKNKAGHQIMYRMTKPDKQGNWDETPNDLELLWEYCRDDVRAERAISKTLRPLIPQEQALWSVDCLMNERGVAFDEDFATAALALIQEEKNTLNDEVAAITGGRITKATQRGRVVLWALEEHGVELPDTKALTINNLLHPKYEETAVKLHPDLARVLEIMTIVNKTSVKKFDVALKGQSSGTRLRSTQMFHGANTGRWAGKGIQPHNLPRGLSPEGCSRVRQDAVIYDYETFSFLQGSPALILSKALRGLFVSKPGSDFFVADYSSIEARVVLWLAGEERALEMYRQGTDLYIDMAQSIYNCSAAEVDADRRWLGKQCILGLGYSMGAVKFKQNCSDYGVDIPIDFAKRVVSIYRDEKYSKVVTLWEAINHCAIKAVKTGEPVSLGNRFTFFMSGRFLHIRLPSGRLLSYAEPTVSILRWWLFTCVTPEGEEMTVATKTKPTAAAPLRKARELADEKGWTLINTEPHHRDSPSLAYMTSRGQGLWKRDHTYGGKLTENVTQAIARDVLAAAMMRLHDSKDFSELVLTVHDEVVCEADPAANVNEFEALMSESPEWADGMPIGVEAWQGSRYGKA